VLRRLLAAYRRTGADPPFGDPARAHGVGMEGYYWRLTDHAAGRVVVAICGVAQAGDGPWAMVILAAHPGGFVRVATTRTAWADPHRLGVWAEDALMADASRLRVDLGPDARVDVALGERRDWPRRAFGALGVAQAMPGLHQYWHPHLLGGRAVGSARLGGEQVALDAAATPRRTGVRRSPITGGGGRRSRSRTCAWRSRAGASGSARCRRRRPRSSCARAASSCGLGLRWLPWLRRQVTGRGGSAGALPCTRC
jgi:hypothetical protein